MNHIVAKPISTSALSAWVVIDFYWPGRIEFVVNRRCISLFLSEKAHNCKVDYVKSLTEEFPKLFTKVDFYTEEGINKVMLDISTDYNVEFK